MTINIFTYENYQLELNKPEILLVPEFGELMSLKWNSGETGDKDGRKRERAFKAFAYIYLAYDWKSIFSESSEKERRDAALESSGLNEKYLEDPVLKAAIKRYVELQDTRITKLLKSAYRATDELRLFFDLVDLQERDPETGKYIFKSNDLMSNIASIAKTVEALQMLEHMVKKEKEKEKGLRGDAIPGLFED